MVIQCEQVWREVSNYVDGDLDAALRLDMEEHIKTCPRCASVLAGVRNVVVLYGDERMLEVPAGFSRRLQNRLAVRPMARLRWPSWETWLAPVAAMALIVGGVRLANDFSFTHPVKSPLALPGNSIPADMVVVVSDDSRLFHVPGCKFIRDPKSERTLTAKEAIREGYAPCSRCLRQYLKAANGRGENSNDDDDADDDAGASGSAVVLGSSAQ
ncbi:MAG TPA: zf-HC2 domain-containing protein [Candidatus Binatia bacterium]|nr:zf-HC2 domain-containing protein [Candidatus Binatia bacterium]